MGTIEKSARDRWQDANFVRGVVDWLEQVRVEKSGASLVDLRGIVVGDPELPLLFQQDFQNISLKDVDFSHGVFSCSFVGCRFEHVKLSEGVFDACRLSKAVFTNCEFRGAVLTVTADDARFERCDFVEASIQGRRGYEYGGRRVSFIECDFSGALWQSVEFRAAKFRDCQFEGARFDRCDLRGAKFDGNKPSNDQLIGCITSI